MLCLRVLQAAVVYVNTLMVQDVLAEGLVELGAADRRGLTPLFWTNISPYGEVRLNMANRLALRATTAADPAGGDDDPAPNPPRAARDSHDDPHPHRRAHRNVP